MPSQISPGVYDVDNGVTVHLSTLTPTGDAALTAMGWQFEISGKIEGLTGLGTALYGAAVNAILAVPLNPPLKIGVGLTGQPGATLREYRVRPLSNGVVEFRLVFRAVGSPQNGSDSVVRATVSAVEVSTSKSPATGKLFQCTGPNVGLQTKQRSIFSPQSVVEVRRQELTYPDTDGKDYARTVNSGPCPWDKNAKPRCWLCVGIEEDSHDFKSWEKVYRFQYNPPKQIDPVYIGGWDELATATDANGNPDVGTSDTLSIAFEDPTKPIVGWQAYPTQDFMVFAFII